MCGAHIGNEFAHAVGGRPEELERTQVGEGETFFCIVGHHETFRRIPEILECLSALWRERGQVGEGHLVVYHKRLEAVKPRYRRSEAGFIVTVDS